MFNREAAQYFDIDALPQQCTSTDCGVMVCLFAWMSIRRFREEDLWCNKLDIPDSNESFQLVRLFLAYITLYFSDYYGVHDCAVRSDTVKWMSVKLFPFAKKKIRIDDRLLNSTTISSKDRLKYISLHFPDTLELFEYLKQSAEENIELPKVFSCDDTDFKNFIHLVRNSDWVERREMLLFTCFNKDAVTSLNKILQSNKWKISYELQELSVWPWSEAQIRSDTVKWMSVKLFPFAKKKIRIDDRLLNSTTISNKDRLKYISLHFPDTLELFEYLKQSAEENIELPKVFSCDDTDFKNFIHLVRNSDWVEWREMLLFTCFNKDAVTSLNKILQSNKWKISYELQELSVWPWSEAQIISILHD